MEVAFRIYPMSLSFHITDLNGEERGYNTILRDLASARYMRTARCSQRIPDKPLIIGLTAREFD